MQTIQRILSLFQVLVCVELKSQIGNVFTGTEGGCVEISCNYPDGYHYMSHYFCRHPCSHSDVLIKAEAADKVTSEGRYSILNTVSTRSLSVTIRNLRLGDSGVYYCGVDKWGKDILSEVEVTVRKELPVYGGVFGLLLCCVLAALVVLYRRPSNTHITSLKAPAQENETSDSPLAQEEVCHVYYEMLAVYSLAGPANEENSSGTYSIIHYTCSTEEECSTYSLIAPH
ncbi:CMRF35-like molecule 8 [Colossoma macropomum]|uniref:CMRF35-like molecule 8 n=1 Tax=Colossoma macropomum TaxID=42526 RepID=UPI0018646BC0|nr:CMRF35-like molecule 8 [Colossoma macropomum]